MALAAEIVARPDHLRVELIGEFALDRGLAVFADVVRRAGESRIPRVVIDARRLSQPLSATEKVLLGNSLESGYRAHLDRGGAPLRAAFLLRAERLTPYRPLIHELRTIGIDAESFSEPAELARWLDVAWEEDAPA